MKWIKRWLARREHARLVAEARQEWRLLRTYRVRAEMCGLSIGYWVWTCEENGIGDRRMRILARPRVCGPEDAPAVEIWARCIEWVAQAELKSIPMKEIV